MKIIAFALILLFSFCNSAIASQWYLIKAEPSPLYSAVAVYRVETTLIQVKPAIVSLWVKTDFLRPKDYEYPKQPRTKENNFIQTDAYLWQKENYIVHCGIQRIDITDASYMLAGEFIEWESNKPRSVEISPDSIFEVIYKLSCSNSKAREKQDIQRMAETIEKSLLPDPKEQEKVKKEENVPKLQI